MWFSTWFNHRHPCWSLNSQFTARGGGWKIPVLRWKDTCFNGRINSRSCHHTVFHCLTSLLDIVTIYYLGGGFRYVLFSPLFWEDEPILTSIFFKWGWFNHQVDIASSFCLAMMFFQKDCAIAHPRTLGNLSSTFTTPPGHWTKKTFPFHLSREQSRARLHIEFLRFVHGDNATWAQRYIWWCLRYSHIFPLANESLICRLLGMAWIVAMVEAPYKICISGTCGTIAVQKTSRRNPRVHGLEPRLSFWHQPKTVCFNQTRVAQNEARKSKIEDVSILLISTKKKHDLMPNFRFDSGQKSVYASIVMVIMLYHPQNTSEICWWDRRAADLPDWIPWTAHDGPTPHIVVQLGDRNSNLCNVR